ncbi:MAG: low-specificity L-threonine aldolase [Chloroflexi bacterium]|nr:low-specificity L-threonine aldolase [Chloroflexota bacterium]
MRIVDLRSDTVTLPSPAMREAIYRAELGDDVYGEDPTVNRLQEMAAERLGKEAALLVVSGTMGNLVSLLTHCGRGDEIIMGDKAHTFLYEAGGVSALGGIHVHTVPNTPNGGMDLAEVEAAIRPPNNIHFPRTKVICLENTHNRCGGAAVPLEHMAAVRAIADRHHLAIHLDGARIFNAAIALGVPASAIAAYADSVQFCLSKGLAAPVGSLICGSKAFIEEARRTRKMVGGGMRQAGIIAAAGIVALEQMVDRLAEDHANAKRLAEGLANIPGIVVDPASVRTNIVMFGLKNPRLSLAELSARFAAEGVKINPMTATQFRAVTHYGIEREDIEVALAVIQRVMAEAA